MVCPAFESATATVRVAVTATGPGLRTSRVTEPNQGTDAGSFKVLTTAGQQVRVSAPLPDPFGATSVVAAENGPERGLSASGCIVPGTEHWFTGVDVRTEAQSEVVVANLDGTSASVDLVAYGENGKVPAPRGVQVAGNSSATISLGVLPRTATPLTVKVSSSDGRVAAFVRQRTWNLDVPLGVDWLPSGRRAGHRPGAARHPVRCRHRRLVLTNPGDRTSTVTVGVLSDSGPIELAGAEQVEVPAGTDADARPRRRARAAGRGAEAHRHPARDRRHVAGQRRRRRAPRPGLHRGDRAAARGRDLAAGGGQVREDRAPAGQPRRRRGQRHGARLRRSQAAAGQPKVVTVPPGSIVTVSLDAASSTVIRLQTTATDLRAALVSTVRLGKVHALAVIDLAAQEARGAKAAVVFDPHAGS